MPLVQMEPGEGARRWSFCDTAQEGATKFQLLCRRISQVLLIQRVLQRRNGGPTVPIRGLTDHGTATIFRS